MNEELENQSTFCMRIDCVNVTNDDFFTKQRLSDWGIHIAKCCLNICETLINKVEPSYHVQYFVSEALINEVVCDAVIGMGKIIDKTPHPVEHPNAFKIAAYLGYWLGQFTRNYTQTVKRAADNKQVLCSRLGA